MKLGKHLWEKGQVELPYFPVFVQGANRAMCRCQILCKRLQENQCALCHHGQTKKKKL